MKETIQFRVLVMLLSHFPVMSSFSGMPGYQLRKVCCSSFLQKIPMPASRYRGFRAGQFIACSPIGEEDKMFEAYHGVTGAQHQHNFNRLFSQGYRMISLSVYGDPSDPRYAAVWVERQGSAWVAVHGVDGAGYQSFFNTWTAKGFVPVLVSATGQMTNAVFAAVFEQGITGPWFARHNMTSGPDTHAGTFQNQNATAHAQRMILRSVAIYGTPTDRRYAAVWHANPGVVKWHVHPSDTAADYQVTFNTETQLPGYQLAGYRPAYVALSADQIYCSEFNDNVVGPWVAQHGMTAADYQSEFDIQTARGFYPICVQGGGVGDQTRYAAIFAQRDIPLAREWTVTGVAVPTLAGFDHIMQSFMQANAVRTAQLTIAKDGVTKFARAYTWAEAGYRLTQPSDRFLLASCSKIFTAAAIQSLYDARTVTPTTAAYPLLGFSHPADLRSDTITIQQLLDHTGGYDDSATGSGFDPTYSMCQIALSENAGSTSPVNRLGIARYMYARPLDFAPGTNYKYSNYGYLLLSAIVEHVSGMDFFDYVQKTLLQPAGITEVLLSSTLASQRATNEEICEDEGLGLSPTELKSQLLVPAVYGGDGQIKEVAAGCAGLAASATALTQFIHLHAVWGNGPRPANGGSWLLTRTGSSPGGWLSAVPMRCCTRQ
jgi:CubicO group peptidase (beta-lactamase class C family)